MYFIFTLNIWQIVLKNKVSFWSLILRKKFQLSSNRKKGATKTVLFSHSLILTKPSIRSVCLEKSTEPTSVICEWRACFQDRIFALIWTIRIPTKTKHDKFKDLFQTQSAHQAFIDLKFKSYSAICGVIRNNISAKRAQSKNYCSLETMFNQPLNETSLFLIQDS